MGESIWKAASTCPVLFKGRRIGEVVGPASAATNRLLPAISNREPSTDTIGWPAVATDHSRLTANRGRLTPSAVDGLALCCSCFSARALVLLVATTILSEFLFWLLTG